MQFHNEFPMHVTIEGNAKPEQPGVYAYNTPEGIHACFYVGTMADKHKGKYVIVSMTAHDSLALARFILHTLDAQPQTPEERYAHLRGKPDIEIVEPTEAERRSILIDASNSDRCDECKYTLPYHHAGCSRRHCAI